MPHISSRKLDRESLDGILVRLISIFKKAGHKHKTAALLDELLTETEKVMLAKRLSIVLLLQNGIPQHRIAETFKVSPTTVSKLSLQVELGKYDAVKNISAEERFDLEKIIQTILTAGGIMPPRTGKRYWRKR